MAENLLNSEYLRSEIKRQFGTQSAFARHMGWSRQYLSQVLNGKVNVTLAQLMEITRALDLQTGAALAPLPSVLRERAAHYVASTLGDTAMKDVPEENVAMDDLPFIDIESLPVWSPEEMGISLFKSEDERRAFVHSLTGKYRDHIPSTADYLRRKQEEKKRENGKQYGLRS